MDELKFESLLGKVLKEVIVNKSAPHTRADSIIFILNEGKKYKLEHDNCCCESVDIEDVCGDVEDLLNTPLLIAEESINDNGVKDDCSGRWTFYKLATIKGHVTIRFWGEDNYYGVEVDFTEMRK